MYRSRICTPDDRADPLGSSARAAGASQRTTTGVRVRARSRSISRCTVAVVTTPGCMTS
jgi:hypothetical protein